jgi:thioredoxin-like negative regulator of GroEL
VIGLQRVAARQDEKPRLVFFYSNRSGACRRVEAYLAQVLQRRGNHDTFEVHHVDVDVRPRLAERLRIDQLPSLCVVEDGQVQARLRPRGCKDIKEFLAPWLQ